MGGTCSRLNKHGFEVWQIANPVHKTRRVSTIRRKPTRYVAPKRC